MSVTLKLTDIDVGGQLIQVFGTVALSGNYPTGGDTVDWTTLNTQISRGGQTVASSMSEPSFGPVQASFQVQGGTPNLYNVNQGTTPSNWKMRAYSTGSAGAEFTGGAAYPASATGDIITFFAIFRKLLLALFTVSLLGGF